MKKFKVIDKFGREYIIQADGWRKENINSIIFLIEENEYPVALFTDPISITELETKEKGSIFSDTKINYG